MDAGVQSSRASEEPVRICVSSLNPASLSPKMYLCLVSGTLIGSGKEMGKGCVLRGETAWTQGVLTSQQADQSGPKEERLGEELGDHLERWTGAQGCDPNSAMGSKSEVKDVEPILFHFTYLLCNMLLILVNPKLWF